MDIYSARIKNEGGHFEKKLSVWVFMLTMPNMGGWTLNWEWALTWDIIVSCSEYTIYTTISLNTNTTVRPFPIRAVRPLLI